MKFIFLVLFSYLLGSVPAFWLTGGRGRQLFSMRAPLYYTVGIKRSLAMTGVDFCKGFLACLIGLIVAGWGGACLAAIAVNVGAVFPLFNGFQQTGSTVSTATAAGALLVLSPWLLLAGLFTFVFALFVTQYLSLSVVLSTLTVLILVVLFPPVWFVFLAIVLLGIGVLYLSWESVLRFVKGREPVFPIRRWIR